jgi:hypothetical protein
MGVVGGSRSVHRIDSMRDVEALRHGKVCGGCEGVNGGGGNWDYRTVKNADTVRWVERFDAFDLFDGFDGCGGVRRGSMGFGAPGAVWWCGGGRRGVDSAMSAAWVRGWVWTWQSSKFDPARTRIPHVGYIRHPSAV